MRYQQHANFHIKEKACVHWLGSMIVRPSLLILWIVGWSLIIELQWSMQTWFFFSMITGQWWVDETDWCALTGHGLHLTNINSIASLKKSMRVVYTRLFQFSVDGMWRWCCFPCILRDNERERERGRRKCASIFFFVYFINWIERTEWTMGSLREEIGDSAPSSSPSNRIRVENSFSANWKWY